MRSSNDPGLTQSGEEAITDHWCWYAWKESGSDVSLLKDSGELSSNEILTLLDD